MKETVGDESVRPSVVHALNRVPAVRGVKKRVKSGLACCLDLIGVEHQLRGRDLARDVRRFIEHSPPALRAQTVADGPAVLFFGARALSGLTTLFTGLVSYGLRFRGARPCVVLCDEALPACESAAITDFADWREFASLSGKLPACARCFQPTASVIAAFGLPYMRLSDYVDHSAVAAARAEASRLSLAEILSYKLDGADLGDQVRTSLYRFFLTGEIPDNERTLAVARRYLGAAIIAAKATRQIIAATRPVSLVSHHGIYLLNGTAMAVARRLGVRVAAYDGTYRRNCVIISHGDTYHHELRSEPSSLWEHEPLSEQQARILDEYQSERRKGSAAQDLITYHPNPISDRGRIAAELGLTPEQKTIALFTNVAWDGRVHVADGIFSGPIEWVLATLRHLAGRDGVRVVVRVHPAEVKNHEWSSRQRMDDEIRRAFPELPSNVVVVPPESDVNTYSLATLTDLAVVYSTKMGLEALLMGIPVLIAGEAFYGKKGIGIEPRTREDYFAVLDRLDSIHRLAEPELERVRRYAYHYYFRRTLELPALHADPRTRPVGNLADILPGKQPGLDALVIGILGGVPFADPRA